MSIERDCSGAGIFLDTEGGELGGVRGSDEVKAEVEYDFLIGEGVWMFSKLEVVDVDEAEDTEKKEDEVDEFDDDLVEVHAKEIFEMPDAGRANSLFSGCRRGELGRVATGEEGSECDSSGRM